MKTRKNADGTVLVILTPDALLLIRYLFTAAILIALFGGGVYLGLSRLGAQYAQSGSLFW